jgi:predicted permease
MLLPRAERDEVLSDLEAEYHDRVRSDGRLAADRWVRRQALGSALPLFKRSWWRGMTGFEPDANRMQPGGPMFETWIKDTRYSARRLIRRPLYAALAVLTLAIGAGGTAAVFSIVRTLLLDALPIAREDQVGVLWFGGSWNEREFLTLRPTFSGFQSMAAYRPGDVTLETPGSPARLVPTIAVSAEFFDVLGVAPRLGRTFRPGDDLNGSESVVVLSDAEWRDLGGDSGIVGKRLQLGGIAHAVVGVMPPGFWFPTPMTRIWTAAQMSLTNRSGQYTLVGRIAGDQAMDRMAGPLGALTGRLAANFKYPDPVYDKTRNPSITPIREELVGDQRPSLVATMAAMTMILLIGCANVAALMLGQVDARATEFAVRAALGADRRRLIQQLGIEALLVGLMAGMVGAVLAVLGFEVLLQSLSLGSLADTARLDWTVLWSALGAALGGAVIVGVVSGNALWRGASLQPGLSTSRTAGVGARGGRVEGGLVIAQIALAVLVASGAGLLIRSVHNLQAIEPGLNVHAVAVVDATMPLRMTTEERRRLTADGVSALAALPGVTSAAAVQKLPLRGSGDNWRITIKGKPQVEAASTAFRMVTHHYFGTLGVPIRRGRDFSPADRVGSERVVVVNEALAARFFPGEDPIGRYLQTFDEAGERIIGIVGNMAEAELTDGPVAARYMLYDHLPFSYPQVSFVMRTESEATTPGVIQAARAVLARGLGRLAIAETTTLNNIFTRAIGPAANVVTLLSILAILALLLGAVGVYGVISHYVRRRARDYGIHIALGQPPSGVVRQVMQRAAVLVSVGSLIGVLAALASTRLFASLLYDVEATDPLALSAAVALLVLIGMLAALVPARRASRTDPAVVLRQP